MPEQKLDFKTIREFYPYYLTQHSDFKCRTLHFVGTGAVIGLFITMWATLNFWLFLLLPVVGYGCAWIGHFAFEHNKPAAFKNPLWSLACDFIMFWDILTGQIGKKLEAAQKQFPEYFTN